MCGIAVGLQRLQASVQEAAEGVREASLNRYRGRPQVQGEDEENVGCPLRDRQILSLPLFAVYHCQRTDRPEVNPNNLKYLPI